MNSDLQVFLNDIQEMCHEIAPEPSVAAMLAPSHLREKCRQEASEMVARNNMISENPVETLDQLVTDLTALMLQVKVIILLLHNTFKTALNQFCTDLMLYKSQ